MRAKLNFLELITGQTKLKILDCLMETVFCVPSPIELREQIIKAGQQI